MAGRSARAGKLNPLLALAAIAAVAGLALLTQEAAAARVGRFIGGLWVSTVETVMRLLAALFGG